MNCNGLFGKLFGHSYEGRYDSRMPDTLEVTRATTSALEALKTHVYRCDVCSRCGSVVNRQSAGLPQEVTA